MPNSRNGIMQWIAGGLATVLFAFAFGWMNTISGQVSKNTEQRQYAEGEDLAGKVKKIETKVDRIEYIQIQEHHEGIIDRDLLNRIARKMEVDTAPDVQPLPPTPDPQP